MRVIAQHNLWFRGKPHFSNYKLQGRPMTAVSPLLGRRNSSDRAALEQEMQWLHRYSGRDGSNFVYALEWIRPGDLIDRNLNSAFLPEVERTAASWCIFYDPVLAARQRDAAVETPIDYSRHSVGRLFRSDMAYLWDNYFGHERYWRLHGKPVLYIWSVTSSILNAEPLIDEVRRQGVYVLGDVFGGTLPAPELDGYTGFVLSTPELAGRITKVRAVRRPFEGYYRTFREQFDGDMIPALSAQYDDTNFQSLLGGPQTRILATGKSDIVDFLHIARDAAHDVDGDHYVFFGTTNNWAEGSSILPTRLEGDRFLDRSTSLVRIGNYRFAHLEAMSEVLFPTQAPYRGPRIDRLAGGAVRFRDCDVLGKLRVRGRVENPPDWVSGANLGEHRAGERLWRPEGLDRVTLRFENLDGSSVKVRIHA